MNKNKMILIEGELININAVSYVFLAVEPHKEFKYHVYVNFLSGARTYFKFQKKDEAESLMIFLTTRYEIALTDSFSKNGRGRGLQYELDLIEELKRNGEEVENEVSKVD